MARLATVNMCEELESGKENYSRGTGGDLLDSQHIRHRLGEGINQDISFLVIVLHGESWQV